MSVEIIRGGIQPGAFGKPLAGIPRRGYFHADEFEGVKNFTRSQFKAKEARLDAKWAGWANSIEGKIAMGTMTRGHEHIDVGETIYFLRELAEIKAKAYDVKYAKLKGRMFVPVIGGDPGAETVIVNQFDYSGNAVRINASAQDFPEVNASGKQYTTPYNSYGVKFSYSIPELRASMKAGRSVEAMRATAARMALAQKQDDILSLGDLDADNGSGVTSPMLGLISFALAGKGAQTVPPASVNAATTWIGNKSPDQIIADINALIYSIPNATKEVEMPNRVLLPVAQYNYCKSTKRTAYADETILEAVQSAWADEGIKFIPWNRLAGAGAGSVTPGTAPYDLMLAYTMDEDHLNCPVPIEYQQMAPQLERMRFNIYCEMRMSGVISLYPGSLAFSSGI